MAIIARFGSQRVDTLCSMTTAPLSPEPDTKDWTWTLTRPCPECGFDATTVRRDEVAPLTRRYAGLVHDALLRPDAAVRPRPAVWSPLEYACHVRDVCTLFAERLQLMLTEDDPLFANWDQDVTALESRYWTQNAQHVAAALQLNSDYIADAFAAVRDDQWQRPGSRSNGSVFTVDTFARYFLHDLAHHAWDVRPTQ
jgi:hypothetical protein